ncbi:hypothetical protein KUTeg_009408 [Tegillarca granosa]|uniref:J domain-containing protein n=1 Tax=Tegillarca granosa TaxID=220873 RepID=A0ABQ9F3R5_TEGGR|nr:hypothetical protein KUTeg_009408 [Tegillarca granosa]
MFILRVWKVHKCGNCLQSFKTSYLCLIRKTHYDTLGVQPTATQSEIRLAYLKACKKLFCLPCINMSANYHNAIILTVHALICLPIILIYEYRSETKEWRTYRDFNNSTYYTRSRNSNRYTGDYTHPKANYTVFEKSSEFATISFVTIIMMFLIVHHINEVMSRDLDHQLKMGHSKQKHYSYIQDNDEAIVLVSANNWKRVFPYR